MRVDKADIIITDPMYICEIADWEGIEQDGRNMSLLGFRNFICRPTSSPDGWNCVARAETNDGKRFSRYFCGDSGQVGVFLLDEVFAYRPDFWAEVNDNPQNFAIIRGFEGEIEIECGYTRTMVKGEGNIRFFTKRLDVDADINR